MKKVLFVFSVLLVLCFFGVLYSAQVTVDNVSSLTTPQSMMQAIDTMFTELYGKWTALGAAYDTSAELDALFSAKQDASTAATDAEVSSAVSTHAGEADPHTGYQLESDMATDVPANETDPVVGAIDGIVKANGAGVISQAVSGTDYQPALGTAADGGYYFIEQTEVGVQGVAVPGDWKMFYTSTTGEIESFDLGTIGYLLTSNGTGGAPTWTDPATLGGGISDLDDLPGDDSDNDLVDEDILQQIGQNCLSSEPGAPVTNRFYCSDGDTWQVDATRQGTNDWLVWWNGSSWVAYLDLTAGSIIYGERCLEPVVIAEPDTMQGISDAWPLYSFPAESYPSGFTVTAIHIWTSETCTDGLNFEEWSQNGTAWNTDATVEAITLSGVHTEDDGTLTDASIAADASLFVDLADTPTDINWLKVQVCGY